MAKYFEPSESMIGQHGNDIMSVLKIISNKYLGANPKQPLNFKLINENTFKKDDGHRIVFDLDRRFPDAKNEQSAYIWTKFNWVADAEFTFIPTPNSPMRVHLNGELVYRSSFLDEKIPAKAENFKMSFKKGGNNLVIQFIKTKLGFGGLLTPTMWKGGGQLTFMAPSSDRNEQAGFLYTAPMDGELSTLPSVGDCEASTGVCWYPVKAWSAEQLEKGNFGRIYGVKTGSHGFAWAKAEILEKCASGYTLSGTSEDAVKIYVNGALSFSAVKGGAFEKKVDLKTGENNILVESTCGSGKWGFSLDLVKGNEKVTLNNPAAIRGFKCPWLFIGPFAKDTAQSPEEVMALDTVFATENGDDYWRVDLPGTLIRPYLETQLYGRWNYPLGVTLYGLIQTAQITNRPDMVNYIKDHIENCTSFFKYSLWDNIKYGKDGFNIALSDITSLDDCGSFSSMILETSQYASPKGYREAIDYVANYITNKQARLEDGAFYRIEAPRPEMFETLWIDDLYMSTPFLSRYYKLTGDRKYIDDAANQFKLFMKYLYVPETKVCSHVYYTDRKLNTGIPWGRGNGWMLFSLSELLAYLPEDHKDRTELLKIFNLLCEGYLARQDEDGMWHQVLTDPESYQEASCTAMFIYAYARGIRMGLINDPEKYTKAVFKGWQALMRIAVDKEGNIYGICRGSGHSFTPRYYKYDLGWNLNDTHGIGIVLLAGIEALKLQNWLSE